MRRATTLLPTLLPALLLLSTARASTAQDWRPAEGDRSIAFGLPSGGGSGLALWGHHADGGWGLELDVHGDASFVGDPSEERDLSELGAGLSVGPAFKRYRDPIGPVLPFLYTGFGGSVGWNRRDGGSTEVTRWTSGLYGRAGIGVDWVPLERISIGGYTGVRADYRFQPGAETADVEGPDYHRFAMDLFTSSLTLPIYS